MIFYIYMIDPLLLFTILCFGRKKLKKSQCTPLFMAAYKMRGKKFSLPLSLPPPSPFLYFSLTPMHTLFPCNTHVHHLGAGAVIHTHSKAAVMATLLYPGKEFKITHQEMIKGISRGQTGKKYRYHDELVVPIIENTPEERDLTVSYKF